MKAFPLFTENKTSCSPPSGPPCTCDLKICPLFPFSMRIKPFFSNSIPRQNPSPQSPVPSPIQYPIPGSPQNNTSLICFLFPQLELHTSLLLSSRAHSGSLYIHIPSPSWSESSWSGFAWLKQLSNLSSIPSLSLKARERWRNKNSGTIDKTLFSLGRADLRRNTSFFSGGRHEALRNVSQDWLSSRKWYTWQQ